MTSEPICFPACPKCADGCPLAASSKLKTVPTSERKTRTWRPDIVTLKCGQEVPQPIFMFGEKTQVWCEIHGEWERLEAKKKPRKPKEITDVPFF